MVEAAAALKACKDEAKEPRAMANKAGSKASKKWTLVKRVEVQSPCWKGCFASAPYTRDIYKISSNLLTKGVHRTFGQKSLPNGFVQSCSSKGLTQANSLAGAKQLVPLGVGGWPLQAQVLVLFVLATSTCSPHHCVGFLLLVVHFRPPSPPPPPPAAPSSNTHTHNLHTHTYTTCPHTQLTHTISHTQLPHKQLPHTHTTSSHTTYSHTQLAHTQLTYTQLTYTQLPHTQLNYSHTHNLPTHNLLTHKHLVTSTVTLRGRRGTFGTGLALVKRLVPVCRRGRRGTLRGRHGTYGNGLAGVTRFIPVCHRGRRGTLRVTHTHTHAHAHAHTHTHPNSNTTSCLPNLSHFNFTFLMCLFGRSWHVGLSGPLICVVFGVFFVLVTSTVRLFEFLFSRCGEHFVFMWCLPLRSWLQPF